MCAGSIEFFLDEGLGTISALAHVRDRWEPVSAWDMRTQSTARQRTMDEEPPVKKKTVHEIGQDLSLLSVDELSERITLLDQEITRMEAARKTKQASRAAADQFFKK
jgi:uncharacterized small protein (DUF1192 family)